MSKFVILLVLAITSIQISFSSSLTAPATFSENDVAILNSKRQNLLKLAFSELRKALWQDETFEVVAQYMRDIKEWSNTVDDDNFPKSEFLTEVHTSLKLLNTLKEDRLNCEIHTNFLTHYVEIRILTRSAGYEFRRIQIAFASKLDTIIKKQSDQLFAKLKDEIEAFIKDLNDAEKIHAHDLIEWYNKFESETDLDVMQHMAIDFLKLYSKEQLNANSTCLPDAFTQ